MSGTTGSRSRATRYAFVPFVLLAAGAQTAGAFDGPLANPQLYRLSLVLLALAAFPVAALGRHRPSWAVTTGLFLYMASASALILSQSDTRSGLTLVLLTPVVAMAMRGSVAQSVLMVLVMTGAVGGIAFYHHQADIEALRTALLWAGMGVTVLASSHGVRSRLAAAEAQLGVQARTDPLTGIANRRGFREGVSERRGRRGFAVVFLDLDGFKQLNDTRGHDAGDEVLRQVAASLWGAVRAGDIVARLGGDEFVVFLADAGTAEAEMTAARLAEAIAALDGDGEAVRASVGLAVGQPSSDLDEVLAAADQAMYENKRRARAARVAPEVLIGEGTRRLSPIG